MMSRPVFASIRKVDFLIGGTQKGGTTALDLYLRGHPQIGMANPKEAHFFDTEPHFTSNDAPDYSTYLQFFAGYAPHLCLGDATPIYLYWKPACQRIWDYNPEIKWILLLRNPITRAYSHWNMERSRGRDPLPFWEAITTEPARCRPAAPLQHRTFSYLDRGFYTTQLQHLWTRFPREQTLILRSEDLQRTPDEVLQRVCRFLEIQPFEVVLPQEANATAYSSSMSRREWSFLAEVFQAEIHSLETILDWDCRDWLREPAFEESKASTWVLRNARISA